MINVEPDGRCRRLFGHTDCQKAAGRATCRLMKGQCTGRSSVDSEDTGIVFAKPLVGHPEIKPPPGFRTVAKSETYAPYFTSNGNSPIDDGQRAASG
jgi:hypothetical protein